VDCVFHGLRVFISFLWNETLQVAKDTVHGAVTSAVRELNNSLHEGKLLADDKSWSEGNYLGFDYFEEVVTQRLYAPVLRKLKNTLQYISMDKLRVRKVDALVELWSLASVVLRETYSYTPNLAEFTTACSRITALMQGLKWGATVWIHTILDHFPFFMGHFGTLAPFDNRGGECQHTSSTALVNHSTKGQVHKTTHRSGYEEALGKDNQRLQYKLREIAGDDL